MRGKTEAQKPESQALRREAASDKRQSTGVYQLHLELDQPTRMEIGRLGTFSFPAGYYIYTGSALNGLEARIARHRRSRKSLHWHIDYFLQQARIVEVTTVLTAQRLECSLNAEILARPGAQVVVPRFGASDCRCPAHLIHLGPRGTSHAS